MIAVIIGSTGLVGRQLLNELLESKNVTKVITAVRRASGIKNNKLSEVLIPDFSKIKDHAGELKGDHYFSCLGTTIRAAGSQNEFRKIDFDTNKSFSEIAKSHGAKVFAIVSAAGASKKSFVFYNRVKGETEDAIKNAAPVILIYRPGLLLGHRQEKRPLEQLATRTLPIFAKILPKKIYDRMCTESSTLAQRMLKDSMQKKAGIYIIEANEI